MHVLVDETPKVHPLIFYHFLNFLSLDQSILDSKSSFADSQITNNFYTFLIRIYHVQGSGKMLCGYSCIFFEVILGPYLQSESIKT